MDFFNTPSLEDVMRRYDMLAMTPDDWALLDQVLYSDVYREAVKVYQKRENLARPRPECNSLFKLCRYCGRDNKCGCKDKCKYQVRAI